MRFQRNRGPRETLVYQAALALKRQTERMKSWPARFALYRALAERGLIQAAR